MFKVYPKDNRQRAITVYDTKSILVCDKSVPIIEFMVFLDGKWQWVKAENYVPAFE